MTIDLANTPVLETVRLNLRAPRGSDYPVWEAFAMSDRAKYIGGPYTARTSWRAFGHAIGHWAMHGFGSFVFTEKSDPTPLGMVGPWFPKGWPEKELGWTVWHDHVEGTGYAFEAASCARDFAFDELGWETAVSYIDAPNKRSIALAERLGAASDPNAKLPDVEVEGDHDILVYRHPKPEAN